MFDMRLYGGQGEDDRDECFLVDGRKIVRLVVEHAVLLEQESTRLVSS